MRQRPRARLLGGGVPKNVYLRRKRRKSTNRLNAQRCAVGQDEKKGWRLLLFEKTLAKATGGDAKAMVLLGRMYDRGDGVIQEYKEAVKWYRKAAELEHAQAMVLLGVMYDRGDGVIQDYKEAVKWWRKAAELGHADAMYNLGGMYAKGEGVNQDAVEAYAWFNVVAEQGDKTPAKFRDKIKKTMTPDQIAEGRKRSIEIMKSLPDVSWKLFCRTVKKR